MWNWEYRYAIEACESSPHYMQQEIGAKSYDGDNVDETPVRGTISFSKVYQRFKGVFLLFLSLKTINLQ